MSKQSSQDFTTTLFLMLERLSKSEENDQSTKSAQQLYLFGTLGCHLCEEAEALIRQVQTVVPFCYTYVDIITLPDEWLEQLSTQIPVFMSKKNQLNYPFSVLDIQSLILNS